MIMKCGGESRQDLFTGHGLVTQDFLITNSEYNTPRTLLLLLTLVVSFFFYSYPRMTYTLHNTIGLYRGRSYKNNDIRRNPTFFQLVKRQRFVITNRKAIQKVRIIVAFRHQLIYQPHEEQALDDRHKDGEIPAAGIGGYSTPFE